MAPTAPDGYDNHVTIHMTVELAVGMLAAAGTLPVKVAEDSLLEQVEEVARSVWRFCDTQLQMHARNSPRWIFADAAKARKTVASVRHTEVGLVEPVAAAELGAAEQGSHNTPEAGSEVQVHRPVLNTVEAEAAFESAAVVRNVKAGTAG